jgi:hypothetical protein
LFFHALLYANTGHLKVKEMRRREVLHQLSNEQLLKRDALSLCICN